LARVMVASLSSTSAKDGNKKTVGADIGKNFLQQYYPASSKRFI